jgi:hypothetical protein
LKCKRTEDTKMSYGGFASPAQETTIDLYSVTYRPIDAPIPPLAGRSGTDRLNNLKGEYENDG